MATRAVADETLAIWSSEALMKIIKKFPLQLPIQDFQSFKLCTVDIESRLPLMLTL